MKYKFDLHIHSLASGHAYSTVTENARFAKEKGLEMIGLTDHAPKMPGGACELHFYNLNVLPDYIEGVRVLRGVELNILDDEGTIDLPDRIIDRLQLVIASLHVVCITPREATDALVNAAKNKRVHILGHPGDPRYPFDVKAVVKAAYENNTLIEINNASFNPMNSRKGGEKTVVEILKECRKHSYPVILGSDSHYHTNIGNFSYIEPLLAEAEMPEELIINRDSGEMLKFLGL
ncbi:MAG: phosphatase [Clostridiales bacterium]|nr:phosphatase [Clostridiales bacterium]